MATVTDIGGDSGNTWARVRAPVFTSPFLGAIPPPYSSLPTRVNWSQYTLADHSAGYPNFKTQLVKAYQYRDLLNSPESPSRTFSTAMGLNEVYAGESSRYYYLNFGTSNGFYGDVAQEAVDNGALGYAFGKDFYGYDYETTKAFLLGATVNLTYYDYDGNPTTTDVVITSSLFPNDPYSFSLGIYLTTVTIPPFPPGSSRPVVWWSINSVTIP